MFISSYVPFGANGIIIRVEADIRRGIPGVDITGLAQAAVREARERIRVAFRNSGFPFPKDRVLINLAPAGVRKDGTALDLPIALAVMAAAGLIPPPDNVMALGELELSGKLRPVRGALASVAAGLAEGVNGFIVPFENVEEARILANNKVTAANDLKEAVEALIVYAEKGIFPQTPETKPTTSPPLWIGDFSEVQGQTRYKRALEIAATGGHNLLVFGSPGIGKTMLARRFPSIMPQLLPNEAVEVTRLHSLAGFLNENTGVSGLITTPPFRSPHHSASAEGILGGGKSVRPGEITLAHFGTLFLDEAPEFRGNVLQALREPLEDRVVSISRAEGTVILPADFQIILAANPCPCGKLGMPDRENADDRSVCFCSPEEIHRYWRKFSGALLDRVELRLAVNRPDIAPVDKTKEESSETIAKRVLNAVEIQRERFKKCEINGFGIRRNARMTPTMIERFCILNEETERVLRNASSKLGFSGRAVHGILRLARTIADLEGSDSLKADHISEAVQYRRQGDDPYDVLEEN